MAFFEKLGEKISSTSKDVAKKTKDLADITRINMQISGEEDNIKDLYNQIGKKYYELYPNSNGAEFETLCNSVTESLAKIDTYKEQIQSIKGVKKCSNCGAEIDDNSVFCGICGNKTETIEEKPEETPVSPVCPGCQSLVTEDMAFCAGCGKKLK